MTRRTVAEPRAPTRFPLSHVASCDPRKKENGNQDVQRLSFLHGTCTTTTGPHDRSLQSSSSFVERPIEFTPKAKQSTNKFALKEEPKEEEKINFRDQVQLKSAKERGEEE